MRHDFVGIGLLMIAAFLFATRYVVEALYSIVSKIGSGYSVVVYDISNLKIASLVAAVLGVAMLIIGALKKRD